MGKRKPLTARELYLAKRCGIGLKYTGWEYPEGTGPYGKSVQRKRTPSHVRRLLQRRREKKTWSNSDVYGTIQQLYDKIVREGFANFQEFREAMWKFKEAEKFQSYLTSALVEAEKETEGMSEEEIRNLMLLEEV